MQRKHTGTRRRRVGLVATLVGVTLAGGLVATPAHAVTATAFVQRNLVADRSGRAEATDPHLVNAWGMSRAPGGAVWVSDNGTNLSTVYSGAVNGGPVSIQPLVVGIPGGVPTGQAYNDTSGFAVPPSNQTSLFIFAGEGGVISAWYPGLANAIQVAKKTGAVYKGLALVHGTGGPTLLAANFHTGRIDVYDSSFHLLSGTGFRDPNLPSGYAPFNVAEFGSNVVVTYAQQDAARHDDVPGPGHGYVDLYTRTGHLVRRLVSQGALNSPWGLAIAPSQFGNFSNDLLVGNFGNGHINAYDPSTGAPLGTLRDATGHPIVIPGLWGLLVGDSVAGGSQSVWFSAGPAGEAHGLLGLLTVG